MNATTITIVVASHVIDLMDITLSVVFLNGWGWRWEFNENCVDFALVLSEQIAGISLESGVFEISTHFNDMCYSQSWKIMLTPLSPPILIFKGLSDLAFIIGFGFHVSDE